MSLRLTNNCNEREFEESSDMAGQCSAQVEYHAARLDWNSRLWQRD
jgi:hypothetical protein